MKEHVVVFDKPPKFGKEIPLFYEIQIFDSYNEKMPRVGDPRSDRQASNARQFAERFLVASRNLLPPLSAPFALPELAQPESAVDVREAVANGAAHLHEAWASA